MSISQNILNKMLLLGGFLSTIPAAVAMFGGEDTEQRQNRVKASSVYVRFVLHPDEKSQQSLSRFISQGMKDDLYRAEDPNRFLSLVLTVWKVEVPSVDNFITHLEKNKILKTYIGNEYRVQKFCPLSTLSPTFKGPSYVVATFEADGELREKSREGVLLFEGMKSLHCPAAENASLLPEFKTDLGETSSHTPFMTVGRLEWEKDRQENFLKGLQDRLAETPLTITFDQKPVVERFDPFSKDYFNVNLGNFFPPSQD